MMRLRISITALITIVVTGCAASEIPTGTPTATVPPPTETATATSTAPATYTSTPTATSSPTHTPTPSDTPTPSSTPTPSDTPLPTETPTLPPAEITADGNLNCRYGPNQNYLYAWGVDEGRTASLDGRNYESTWLWVQPWDATFHCWVVASGATANVDLSTVPVVYPPLQTNASIAPPRGVSANRSGSSVTISWSAAPPSVELAYLIEARICSGGFPVDVVVTTTSTSYSLTDQTSCSSDSYGQLRVQNKLGYSTAVSIPWP